MTIEEEKFKRTNIDFKLLLKYGFIESDDNYTYTKKILDESFKVDITVSKDGIVTGKIYDLYSDCEYTNFRLTEPGSFANKIKEEYLLILDEIIEKCCKKNYFVGNQANYISDYIIKTHGDKPEFLWEKFPGYAIFRNSKSKKWYALIANIKKDKLVPKSQGEIEILNIKLDEYEVLGLLKKPGFYKAYHMSSKTWITISLDNTVEDEEIIDLIEKSYNNTK